MPEDAIRTANLKKSRIRKAKIKQPQLTMYDIVMANRVQPTTNPRNKQQHNSTSKSQEQQNNYNQR